MAKAQNKFYRKYIKVISMWSRFLRRLWVW